MLCAFSSLVQTLCRYSHTGSAEEKWSEELYASNGGTTFDGQLRAFVRRCHAAEDPQTRSPSPSSSTGSLDRQSDDERDDYDQHAQRRRDGDDAETWWQRNAAGGLAGAVRTAANGGDTEKHSSNQLTTAESESALDDTADFECVGGCGQLHRMHFVDRPGFTTLILFLVGTSTTMSFDTASTNSRLWNSLASTVWRSLSQCCSTPDSSPYLLSDNRQMLPQPFVGRSSCSLVIDRSSGSLFPSYSRRFRY